MWEHGKFSSCLFLVFFASSALASGEFKNCQTSLDPSWKLVWSDEFTGGSIDRSKWKVAVSDHNANGDLEAYVDHPQNLFIKNGILNIQAIKENYHGRPYTSASIGTQESAAWLYGRFEFCAKIPKGQGMWPAIWMMPRDSTYGPWPLSGEIDVLENIGNHPDTNWATIHYGPVHHQMSGTTYVLPWYDSDFSQDFHEFALEWETNVLRFYVDGNLYFTRTPADLGPVPAPWIFDKPFYIIMNLAIGGQWPGAPDANTVFPQALQVSSARVYQR